MAIVICFVLMLALQLATPFWWWVMLVPFGFGLWKSRSAWESARVGMISAGALWLAMSLWQWLNGGQQLALRMSGMLGLSSGAVMVVMTTVVAATVAGVTGACGYSLKSVGRTIESRGVGGVGS